MSTKEFIDNKTVIDAGWLNEVDALVHDVFNNATTDVNARANLGLDDMSLQSPNAVAITGGTATLSSITGGTAVVDSLQLSGGSGTEGTLTWNTDEETLDLIQNGAVLQLGQEMYHHARNNTGVTIPDGTPVMATGTIGASGRITIAPMDGTNAANAKYYLGITTETITDGDDGKVTTFGKIRGLDTSGSPYGQAWAEGEVLWIDTSTVGHFTNIEPGAGLSLPIAFVLSKHATVGTLMSRVTNVDGLIDLKVAKNLADLASASTSRTNLDVYSKAETYTQTEIDAGTVAKSSATGSAVMPTGTTAQRDVSPAEGYLRRNSSLGRFEGYSGSTWLGLGGATGAGGDDVFYENGQTVTTDYTLTTNKNAMSAGPITIDTGITVTIPSGATWVVV